VLGAALSASAGPFFCEFNQFFDVIGHGLRAIMGSSMVFCCSILAFSPECRTIVKKAAPSLSLVLALASFKMATLKFGANDLLWQALPAKGGLAAREMFIFLLSPTLFMNKCQMRAQCVPM
jgi:hypothetical protein